MYPTASEVACLLAVMLQRSGHSRARISAKTLKLLGRRSTLRSAFVLEVTRALSDQFGWMMSELESGGYGVIQTRALEAAKPVTVRRSFSDQEWKALKSRKLGASDFESEVLTLDEYLEDDD